jgi:hypothetical protein
MLMGHPSQDWPLWDPIAEMRTEASFGASPRRTLACDCGSERQPHALGHCKRCGCRVDGKEEKCRE